MFNFNNKIVDIKIKNILKENRWKLTDKYMTSNQENSQIMVISKYNKDSLFYFTIFCGITYGINYFFSRVMNGNVME
jgi:hypothetical protein